VDRQEDQKMNNEEGIKLKKALLECPKCESNKTRCVKKVSLFGAISTLISGIILGLIAPVIIPIKVFLYIVSFKISKINRMVLSELWDKYIVTIKCCLVVLTLGSVNLTEIYICEDCKKRWIV
jgi:hypothetical protein